MKKNKIKLDKSGLNCNMIYLNILNYGLNQNIEMILPLELRYVTPVIFLMALIKLSLTSFCILYLILLNSLVVSIQLEKGLECKVCKRRCKHLRGIRFSPEMICWQ